MTGISIPPEESAGPDRLRQWAFWLIFFIGVLFLTFPGLLTGGLFYLRDFHPFFYPQKHFLVRELASGALPFWQPHVGCGVPFFASLQPGLAYPPTALLFAGTLHQGLIFFVVFHFLLAFSSAALLARHLFRAGPWCCCVAGTGYAFGGYLVSSVSQLNNLQSAAWAPLVLIAISGFSRRPRISGLLIASVVLALQLLGGGVEVTAFTVAAGLLLTFSQIGVSTGRSCDRAGFQRKPLRLLIRPLLVAAVLLVALGLSAFQLLPMIEMAGRSTRAGGGLAEEERGSYSLQTGNLYNVTVPRDLTDPGRPGYFKAFPSSGVPWLLSIYQGGVVIYLALAGLLAGRGRLGLRLALALCACGGVLFALGDSFPLTASLLSHFPGAGWFRYPEKFLFLSALSVPLLAALGCGLPDAGYSKGERRRVRAWYAAAEGLALALPLTLLSMSLYGSRSDHLSRAAGVAILLLALAATVRLLARFNKVSGTLCALLLAALVAADLSTAHRPLNALVPAEFYSEPPAAARLIMDSRTAAGSVSAHMPPRCRSTLPGLPGGPPATERPKATPLETHLVWRAYLSPNSAGIYGISQVRGSTGMELRLPALREQLLKRAGLPDKLALLSLWGVDWLVMDRDLISPDELQLASSELDLPGQRLYRMRHPLPRLFLVDPGQALGYQGAEQQVLQTGTGMTGFVEGLELDIQLGVSLGEQVHLTSWSASRMTAEVVVQREGMMLVRTESHDPGWTARVDDCPAELKEGLGGFSLISLGTPGRHRVELNYRPPGFTAGVVISLSVLLLLLLLSVVVPLRFPGADGANRGTGAG